MYMYILCIHHTNAYGRLFVTVYAQTKSAARAIAKREFTREYPHSPILSIRTVTTIQLPTENTQ